MIRKFLTISFLLLMAVFCFGQNGWKPGYIIKNDGDTVKGYINFLPVNIITHECQFRNNYNSPVIFYKPGKIKAYGSSDGYYFVSSPVKWEKQDYKINVSKEDTLFLECLVKGRISLFRILALESRYFVEKDGQFFELLNSERIIVNEGRKFVTRNHEYIGILNIVLKDANVQQEIQACKFGQNSFIDLMKKYYRKIGSAEMYIVIGDR